MKNRLNPLDIVTDSTVRPTYLIICHFRLNKQQYFHTPCRCIFCGKKGQFFLRRDKSRIGHSISINSCNGTCMAGSVLMPIVKNLIRRKVHLSNVSERGTGRDTTGAPAAPKRYWGFSTWSSPSTAMSAQTRRWMIYAVPAQSLYENDRSTL